MRLTRRDISALDFPNDRDAWSSNDGIPVDDSGCGSVRELTVGSVQPSSDFGPVRFGSVFSSAIGAVQCSSVGFCHRRGNTRTTVLVVVNATFAYVVFYFKFICVPPRTRT